MGCKKIRKQIKYLDCFGAPITFLINNESESKSFIGGIFTIIYKIIEIAYTINVGLKFILTQK